KEYMYKKYVWDEEVEVNIPHFFSKEQQERELNSLKYFTKRYKESRPLKEFGKRYQYDFMWPKGRYLESRLPFGQETFPFYDKRVIELAFQIPPEHHYDVIRGRGNMAFYNGQKMILRKAYQDVLPEYLY